MSVAVDLGELLQYSEHERQKWRAWMAADPRRMDLPFHRGGRFPTLGSILDHTFLVERRHLCRLEGGTPPEATGVAPGDWAALFEYADLVRADLRKYVEDLDEQEARQPMTVVAQSGTRSMTRQRLLTHILLHEVRHLAQLAYAARAAGTEPPGQHDIFYFDDVVRSS
jgi:uncharacterized damage-inducible protein DinB